MCATPNTTSPVDSETDFLRSPSYLLDHLSNQHESDIKSECRLINEIYYNINRSYTISTGFSAARGYLPVVKIATVNNRKCISLTQFEWGLLVNHRNQIELHINSAAAGAKNNKCAKINANETIANNNKFITTYYVIDNIIKIMCGWCVNKKDEYKPTITIERSDIAIELNRSSINTLWKLLDVVNFRLNKLICLNISDCYNILLNDIVQNKGNFESVDEYASKTLKDAAHRWENWTEEHTLIFLEILLFQNDKLKINVGSLRCL